MKYIPLPANTKSHIIKIKPAVDMIPRCYVYVHYIINGDLRYCELSLKFPNEFENTVSISAPSIAKPGQEVQLDLRAKPNSYVGLLAVDLSVYLENPDFNIDRERIFRELVYDLTFSGVDVIYPGQISGLITLTNANYLYETSIEKYERPRSKIEYDTFRTERLKIRSKFPETWIFMDFDNVSEMTQLTFNVPDTITTWLITAFSVNDESGFGMMSEPTNLTVFKTFFISTNLPYSIKSGEVVKIPLVIFNYHNKDLDTRITMNSLDGDYDFIDELTMQPMASTTKSQDIIASANGGNTLHFFIKPKKLGVIRINIKATNYLYNDAILQQLLVEPTGTMENHNKDLFINLKKSEQLFRSSIDIDVPENHVADTEFLQLSVSSDILHTTLDNLDSLVQLPTGCAEQNMVNFAPNVLVLDHLRATRKSSENSDLVKRATGHLEVGYQQELSYRHYNGAYSVFGPNAQTEESTWLTAYITRFFIKAQRYAGVENRIIQSGLHFLESKQLPSGEFQYTGYLFHSAHQDRYGFTAFVLMTFLESSKSSRNYKAVIQKGVNYLVDNINNINDTYALSLVSVALQMSKSEQANQVLAKLQQKSHSKKGLKWWQSSNAEHSNDVEITAYALMALLGTNSLDNINIVKWILEQRNKAGGFKTTHDTVVALQALIRFNQKYPSNNDTLLKFNYAALDAQGLEVGNGFLGIDPSNSKIWQKIELPKTTRLLQLKIEGEGNALVQLAYHYYVPLETDVESITLDDDSITATTFAKSSSVIHRRETPKQKSFAISPMAKLTSNAVMELEVCFKFKPSKELKHRQTNMVIMEINMPSGFVVSPESMHDLQEEEFVARVEVKDSNTKCLAYFKHLQADDDEKCLSIQADNMHEVLQLEPASIIMYDYYIPENRDTIAYQM
ncbi:CD109 antigen [Musca domestica]|uniref:CD109 antigen n=1 Tax=Musca domestica TaxID=7370 RepID=A0A1I8MYP9_MUSDO|nr:CD109 antigen [Musca domestica]